MRKNQTGRQEEKMVKTLTCTATEVSPSQFQTFVTVLGEHRDRPQVVALPLAVGL